MLVLNKKMKIIVGSGIITILITACLGIVLPIVINPKMTTSWNPDPLIAGTASTYQIRDAVSTSFGSYSPLHIEFAPNIQPTKIGNNLENVDKQGLTITTQMKEFLEMYGFVIVDEGYEDIYQIYDGDVYDGEEIPKFITTDLCLHAYHVLYDISLRILEGERFFFDFETMLLALRDAQIALNSTASELSVQEALNKNIAYLSVMLYLLNETNTVPVEVEALTISELSLMNDSVIEYSAIFGYEEDYTQYKVRGHYTRNELLGNYFKAMMYAGRMSFLTQSPEGDPEMGIDHTRMALLLISSFNETISTSNVWEYWDRLYEPTVFYVGASDDLTAEEYYQIWQNNGAPSGDALSDRILIETIIEEIQSYRKPRINSMFVYDDQEVENVTQSFRLMGQRFIPDSYIFQQLVHDKVDYRSMPTGLDVFSVFGSPRADYFMENENQLYPGYDDQINKLRKEFGNLTDYDWTQNLYWLWLFSLFPLLDPATDGYPGFMLSDAWTDKSLMTASGSWAELRHDTILYAKQSYTVLIDFSPKTYPGYVEPYPEVYARLAALVHFMQNGLESRGLLVDSFSYKLEKIADVFEKLTELSIKELQNEQLTDEDIYYINSVAEYIEEAASYDDPEYDPWTSAADDRIAVIADVHTDPNPDTELVLEVGVGNPFAIYVVVQDHQGNLRLTKGATFSYYEFTQPMENRLTDEEWQDMLDTNPPNLPDWILLSIPLASVNVMPTMSSKEK
ncbi:MAG: DUF3160 domain-containing protein [Candidatus Heimdallarchaeota archaeon]|nr:DUF3160 domain-containing protein [Candidatus Heimdallarchaeota archaeon]MCG3255883.1 DUF3160 domain-containing protein [Candidatus Heimdallarchaeota archaeon]MCK4610954.1 DUF3160 domain-containing protein [Candidatus Heimdallarchaeota archaeon]